MGRTCGEPDEIELTAMGVDRFHFEGNVSDADLNDYYLPVFKRPLTRAYAS